MAKPKLDLTKNLTKKKLEQFSGILLALQEKIEFKVSSRGWAYLMEQAGYINKGQFDKIESAINRCRRQGILPVDFVAEEDARAFRNIHEPSDEEIPETLKRMLNDVLKGDRYYTPDWWEGEEYYIQMVVEKIDLRTLWQPICEKYHIPIANSKGWSSILQRAEYTRRFKEAEDMGLRPVLLVAGDHDPDGIRITDTLRKNLADLSEVFWMDGEEGYDPSELIIERFGLNYDFIIANGYTWIDNLITGGKKNGKQLDLSDPKHKNHKLPYVQKYLKDVGARKCEANVVVTTPEAAAQLCTETVEKYLGNGALGRFAEKRAKVKEEYKRLLLETGLTGSINKAIDRL